MAPIADRAGYRPIPGTAVDLLAALILGIKIAKPFKVVSGRRRRLRALAWNRPKFEAVETLGHVAVPGTLRIFAIVDDVETSLGLAADHVRDRLRQIPFIGGIVDDLAFKPLAHVVDKFRRPHKASDMGGLDMVRVGLHRCDPKEYLYARPQISSATSTTNASFAHCSSSVSRLPSSVLAKPHCGLRHS